MGIGKNEIWWLKVVHRRLQDALSRTTARVASVIDDPKVLRRVRMSRDTTIQTAHDAGFLAGVGFVLDVRSPHDVIRALVFPSVTLAEGEQMVALSRAVLEFEAEGDPE